MATTKLHPVGTGNYKEWDLPEGIHYTRVDDDPHDGDTSYVTSANGVGIAGNITPFLRLSSTDNFGSKQSLTDDYVVYTQEVDRPGGGSWSKSDLESVEMGIRTNIGISIDDDDSFTTDPDEVSPIPDSHTIEKVEVQFVGKKVGTKTQDTYCTAVRLIVTHDVAAHPAPTEIEIDHQSSPATNVSKAPKITAIFNGLNSTDVAADVYVQVSEDDSFSSEGIIYDSDWLALSSPGCDEGDRCEGIIYGTGDSAAAVLSSHPPDDKYYVRIKFRDDSSSAIESEWSDTLSGEPSEFSGINRDWALPAYAARCKLYVDTDHSAAIPAGWDLPFSFKTGERTVAGTDGCFNEAVQASGGFQIEGYGSKLFYVYLSKQDPTDANYAIHIKESSDGGETWSAPVNIRSTGTYFDTHYFPTLVIDKLGYIHVTSGAHGGSFYYIRSTNSADISSWETPTTITGYAGTYPVGILVPTKGGTHGRIYWFWRGNLSYNDSFIYSDDGGSTWSSVHDFIIDTNASKFRVYCYGYRYDLNTQRLHVAYTHNHQGDVEKGVWYIYCDLDETDGQSGDYGFNIWRWADDTLAGYSTGASGSAVDYNVSKAIVFAEDHLASIFIECLELDASGKPIVFWEQKVLPRLYPNETYLVCATWNGSSWDTHYISDQVNRMLRVRRSSIGLGRDKDNVIRAIMPVRANTWRHFNPTADLDSVDITRKSEASNYLEVDEGPTDCDKDGSYFDVGTNSGGAQASFSSSTDMIDGSREIFTLEIRAIVKHLGTSSSCYLYVEDGSVEDDSDSISVDSATYEEVSATWDTNPFTSQSWTESDLDSLQFGIKQAGANEFRVTRIFARAQYTLQSDAEWGASEIFELTSSDNGATWQMSRELSRNSGIGVPMMNSAHHLHNNRIHVIWSSGFDLFYFTDNRFGLVQFTGDDLRVYHAGVEIDRVLDYANKNETLITFKCQTEIPANRRAGADDYYVYYGNPNEMTAAKSDPHEVFRDFSNWEGFEHNDDLDGQDGWAVSGGSALAYASPPYHANKVGGGEVSAKCYPDSTADLAFVKTIGSGLTNVRLDILFWMELTDGDNRAWAEFEDSGGNIFGAGLDQAAQRAAYKIDADWTSSSIHAKYKSMHHLRLRVTSAGCSAWWNGNVIIFEHDDSTAISSVDKLRLCCNGGSYFDFSRVGYSWATSGVSDPEVIVQSEEWQGFRIDATLLGRGSDSFIIDATIWGFKMGWVTVVTDAVDPTVVLGSITVTPSAVYALTGISNPTVVLGSVVATPDAATCLASTEAGTVVLGSMTVTASANVLVAVSDPTVILGSISITATVSAVISTGAPTVLLGSTTASPVAASVVADGADPTVVLGSLTLTPNAVTLIASSIQPTVHLGSTVATPSAVSVVLSTQAPVVVCGSTTATPGATSVVTGTANPQVIYGSIIVTPAAATLIVGAVDPSLHFSSTTATPVAVSLIASAIDPTVIGGSIEVIPSAVSCVTSANDPTIQLGSTTATATASVIVASSDPSVILGSLTLTATASVIVSTGDPEVVLGSTSASPDAVSIIISSVDPQVVRGSLTIIPAAVSCVLSAVDPTVLFGSTSAAPAAVSVITSVGQPIVVFGSLTISPTAVAAIISSVNPGVVIGAVTVSPVAVSAITSVVSPSVILGSVTVVPIASAAVIESIDPAIHFGSTTSTPAAVTVIVGVQAPTVIIGAVVVTPAAASAVSSASDPDLIFSSTTASPAATTAIISTVDPSVVLGSITVAPTALSAVISAADPSVVIGAVTVTPDAVTVVASAVNPTILLGSTTATPSAVAVVASTLAPTVLYGSITVQPTPITAIATATNPVVTIGAVSITPAAAWVRISTDDPAVILGSTTVQPTPVSAVIVAEDPVVEGGSITLSPTATTVIVGAVDPVVVLGGISIQPAAVSCIALTSGPTVILGSVTVVTDAVSVIASSTLSAVVLGSLSLSPTAVYTICTAIDPTVEMPAGISVSPEAVAIIAGAVDPSTILGSIQVSPTAAIVYTNIGDPVLVLGSLSISPEAVDAIAGTVIPTVVFGALVITPTSSRAVTVAVSPDIILGSTVSVPNPVTAVADVLAPTVIVSGVILVLPDGRTVTVASEDRNLRVATEDRTLAIAGENRTLTVSSDDRGVLVKSEDRISKISRSN